MANPLSVLHLVDETRTMGGEGASSFVFESSANAIPLGSTCLSYLDEMRRLEPRSSPEIWLCTVEHDLFLFEWWCWEVEVDFLLVFSSVKWVGLYFYEDLYMSSYYRFTVYIYIYIILVSCEILTDVSLLLNFSIQITIFFLFSCILLLACNFSISLNLSSPVAAKIVKNENFLQKSRKVHPPRCNFPRE